MNPPHPKREVSSLTWEPYFKTAAPQTTPKAFLQLSSRDFTKNHGEDINKCPNFSEYPLRIVFRAQELHI